MHTSLLLLLVMLVAAGTGFPLHAATNSTSIKGKKSSSSSSSSKSDTPAKKKTPAKSDKSDAAPAKKKKAEPTPVGPEPVNEDPPTPVATPAVVSTLSIEDIAGFDDYPKQIQSLVQSCLALTHLELGYLYGSSEPSKGGMDCSGTIYHVLHFQGLKDVPRQSDEMCNWVNKKTHLYLTPTATSFGSEEFDNLKPGDLLFWTNSLETTRKLPVTHVMVYLGKLKKSGKRIVFGSSDGRSFNGERRSGVSVFDFSLPRPDSTKHFYGYGPTPGLLPVEPERPAIASVTPPPTPAPAPAIAATTPPKEPAVIKETPAVKEAPVVKETVVAKEPTAAPKESVVTVKDWPKSEVAAAATKTETPATSKKPAAAKETLGSKPATKATATASSVALKEPAAAEVPPATPQEEVRKAIAMDTAAPATTDTKADSKKTASADTSAKTSSSTSSSKSKTSTTKKRPTTVASSSSTRRRTPATPQKSVFEQKVDRAVSSVRRFFQQ